MSSALIASLFVLDVIAFGSNEACGRVKRMPHEGSLVPISVWEPCIFSRQSVSLPAVFIMNGANVEAREYSGFARNLAPRGFVVLVPQYDSRNFSWLPSTIQGKTNGKKAGYDCPENGTFASVALLHSLARFTRQHQIADVDRAVLIGHSFGGVVSAFSMFRLCGKLPPNLQTEISCEGEVSSAALPFRAILFISMEGFVPENSTLPPGTLFLSISSPSFSFSGGKAANIGTGRDRVIEVSLTEQANHFAINDFSSMFNHSRTRCAFSTPEREVFSTTAIIQEQLLRALADIVSLSYYSYANGGDIVVPIIGEMISKVQFVATASVLSEFSQIAYLI